jgi:hypothetical protein
MSTARSAFESGGIARTDGWLHKSEDFGSHRVLLPQPHSACRPWLTARYFQWAADHTSAPSSCGVRCSWAASAAEPVVLDGGGNECGSASDVGMHAHVMCMQPATCHTLPSPCACVTCLRITCLISSPPAAFPRSTLIHIFKAKYQYPKSTSSKQSINTLSLMIARKEELLNASIRIISCRLFARQTGEHCVPHTPACTCHGRLDASSSWRGFRLVKGGELEPPGPCARVDRHVRRPTPAAAGTVEGAGGAAGELDAHGA